MVNKDALRRWAEKLESDMFPQGRSFLKSVDEDGENVEWCCAGVACHQAVEDGHSLNVVTHGDTRDSGEYDEYVTVTEWRDDDVNNGGYGPASLGDYFGIPESNRQPNDKVNGHGLGKYIRMNDRGSTFREIAATIRKDFDL